MNKITPREYSVITGHTVIVYSNGQAYIAYDGMLMPIPDSRIKIDEADLDNMYYPDGTSEWERMRESGFEGYRRLYQRARL